MGNSQSHSELELMPFPFRNPVGGDGDAPETPELPEWATPVKADNTELPEWAKPVKAKSDKPGPLSRFLESVKSPKPFHPSSALYDAVSSIPHKASEFLKEHPKIREAGQRFLTGTSPELEESLKKQGITDVAGPGLMKIPGADKLRDKIKEKGISTGEYWKGAAGSVLSDFVDMASTGFDPRTAGVKQTPIRQSREIPYRMEGDVNLPSESSVKQTDERPLPTRSPNIIPELPGTKMPEFGPDAYTPAEKEAKTSFTRRSTDKDSGNLKFAPKGSTPVSDEEFNLAVKRAGMGETMPEETLKEPSQKADFINPFEKAAEKTDSIKFSHNNPELGGRQYDIEGGSTISEDEAVKRGYRLPESPTAEEASQQPRLSGEELRAKALAERPGEEWKPPDYAKSVAEGSMQPNKLAEYQDYRRQEIAAGRKPIKYGEYENRQSTDDVRYLHGGLGGVGGEGSFEPSTGPHADVLDKLFTSLEESKGLNEEQQVINKREQARRFSDFASVKEEGVAGAAKSLSKLKGEYEKITPMYGKMQLQPEETDQLFTAVKKANITEGEKARGYTALFKLMNGESVPVRSELKILDDVFGNNFSSRIIEMHGGLGGVGIKLSKLANTMKSMQNSISLAAPLRHGIGLVARKEFYPAFADMFKFFGNKEYYNTAMQTLEERPNYMLGREAGLFLSKPQSLMNSEEEFLNSYVGSMPGIKQVVGASQRAYTGFLNKLRADTFDSMIKQAKSLGYDSHSAVGEQIVPTKETKAIARYINNATGRGDLPGNLNKMTNELNLLLWSPRMIASRITMLTNPKIYTDLPKGMRLSGLKSLLGIAALGTIIDTLAAYGGAKVSTNILSTDYGKSRFGTKLIDPWGGFQQYIVGAARFLAGKTDSSTPTSRLEIAGRFLANKESPAASLAHDILTAKKMTGGGNYTTQYGQQTSVQSEIAKRFTPIFVQDIEDLIKTEPDFSKDVGLDAVMGVASLAGMSQNYPEKQKGKLSFRKFK